MNREKMGFKSQLYMGVTIFMWNIYCILHVLDKQ